MDHYITVRGFAHCSTFMEKCTQESSKIKGHQKNSNGLNINRRQHAIDISLQHTRSGMYYLKIHTIHFTTLSRSTELVSAAHACMHLWCMCTYSSILSLLLISLMFCTVLVEGLSLHCKWGGWFYCPAVPLTDGLQKLLITRTQGLHGCFCRSLQRLGFH